jgi:hypothetical protein
MLTILGFLFGVAGGGAGTAAWLLSDNTGEGGGRSDSAERLELLRARLEAAIGEGKRAGAETENRLRHELDAFRRHPDRPGISS